MSSKIDIKEIDLVWKDINDNYRDFYDRMSFLILHKKSDLNENKNVILRDKVHLLVSDMKDIVSSMERICNHMDCSNVNKGIINVNNSISTIENFEIESEHNF
jgi:hypothetical protein